MHTTSLARLVAVGTAFLFATAAADPITSGSLLERATPPNCSYVAKTPPPQGLVCGRNGSLRKPSVVRTIAQTDLQSCVTACENVPRSACISFSYSKGRQCILYNNTVYDSGFRQSSALTTQFWNKRCWQRKCTCSSPLTLCSGSCVDESSDNNNCGGCGQAVKQGETCCSGKSVDLQTDEENCGFCGYDVPNEITCCAGAPTATNDDPRNCGSCGTEVSSGDTCCDGQGVDLSSDSSNCGACGQAVQEEATCCNGTSTNLMTSNQNCGSCGQKVNEGEVCCNGASTNTMTSEQNCGGCGQAVEEGESCCAGQSIDLQSDPENCGSCGTTCTGLNTVCFQSTCVPPALCLYTPPIASTPQLLQNQNFDSGFVDGTYDPPWGLNGDAGFIKTIFDLTQTPPVYVSVKTNYDNDADTFGEVYQDVSGFTPGVPYTLSAWIQSSKVAPQYGDQDADLKACVFRMLIGDRELFTIYYNADNGTQNDYMPLTCDGVYVPQGSARFTLNYFCPLRYIGVGYGEFYFDSASITPTPP